MSESTEKTRNIKFRIYPSQTQVQILVGWLRLHCELYNAALQERRDAWKKARVSVGYLDQQNSLPEVKEYRPELVQLGSHALQETVRRVDRAFKAFFRRIKAGEKPGHPRFKSFKRFDSFTYPDPAGWKVLKHKKRSFKLSIKNLGTLEMRGSPRVELDQGEPRTLTVCRRNGKWYATITVRHNLTTLDRARAEEGKEVGLDAGCLALVATSGGDRIDNPKYLSRSLAELKKAQRALSRKRRGSRNREKARQVVAGLHEKVANQRRDFHHKFSAKIAANYSLISIEDLNLRNMTRSVRGSVEEPGRNVKQKAGLNRSLMDAGIGQLYSMIAYKAEEAGVRLETVPSWGTSQRCSECGENVAKALSERTHICPHCGYVEDRDVNAARNILHLGQAQAGREPAEVWRGAKLPREARNRHYTGAPTHG
jgi:putative transposase